LYLDSPMLPDDGALGFEHDIDLLKQAIPDTVSIPTSLHMHQRRLSQVSLDDSIYTKAHKASDDNVVPAPSSTFTLNDLALMSNGLKRISEDEPSTATLTQRSPLKKARTEEPAISRSRGMAESPLHRACCNPNVTVSKVLELLKNDPGAVTRSVVIESLKSKYNPLLLAVERRMVKEPYTYPLNLAIKSKASPEVLSVLIDAAPSVLGLLDGTMRESPLAVLLKNSPHDVATVDKMLLSRANLCMIKDRHSNTAVHVACTRGASVTVLRHLCIMYPEALEMRNRHQLTPLDLGRRSTASFSEAAWSYLTTTANRR